MAHILICIFKYVSKCVFIIQIFYEKYCPCWLNSLLFLLVGFTSYIIPLYICVYFRLFSGHMLLFVGSSSSGQVLVSTGHSSPATSPSWPGRKPSCPSSCAGGPPTLPQGPYNPIQANNGSKIYWLFWWYLFVQSIFGGNISRRVGHQNQINTSPLQT